MEVKKLKLCSLDPQNYPNTEIECKFVEDIKELCSVVIQQKGTQKAQKTALVNARVGEVGEEIDTRPRVNYNGKLYAIDETKGKVKVEGSMIVKNPDGEEYIVKPEQFEKKYKATEKQGVFEPISSPIEYIICNDNICFEAPWGGLMFGVKGCALNVSNLDDIYAIQNEPFNKTYQQIKQLEKQDNLTM